MSDSATALATVADRAAGCRACPLWRKATRVVFGEGPVPARLMLVGEQPGDREDLTGHPFVGPAGRLPDRALDRAEIDRDDVFLTNVVKHFKWKAKGRRRIHDTPGRSEVAACSPWLAAELDLVRPGVVLCLGATAARALLGPDSRLTRHRGELFDAPALTDARVMATLHPSAVARTRSPRREELLAGLAADAARAAAAAGLR